jgi:hypothetical protein
VLLLDPGRLQRLLGSIDRLDERRGVVTGFGQCDATVALAFAESRVPADLMPLVEILEERALDGPTGHR